MWYIFSSRWIIYFSHVFWKALGSFITLYITKETNIICAGNFQIRDGLAVSVKDSREWVSFSSNWSPVLVFKVDVSSELNCLSWEIVTTIHHRSKLCEVACVFYAELSWGAIISTPTWIRCPRSADRHHKHQTERQKNSRHRCKTMQCFLFFHCHFWYLYVSQLENPQCIAMFHCGQIGNCNPILVGFAKRSGVDLKSKHFAEI